MGHKTRALQSLAIGLNHYTPLSSIIFRWEVRRNYPQVAVYFVGATLNQSGPTIQLNWPVGSSCWVEAGWSIYPTDCYVGFQQISMSW